MIADEKWTGWKRPIVDAKRFLDHAALAHVDFIDFSAKSI
jgi:hypothetical protein